MPRLPRFSDLERGALFEFEGQGCHRLWRKVSTQRYIDDRDGGIYAGGDAYCKMYRVESIDKIVDIISA